MSLILLNHQDPENQSLQTIFQNILRIMVLEFQAVPIKSESQTIYQTFLQVSKEKIQLFWRFEHVISNNSIKVFIRPILSDRSSGNFRAQTQRNFVDLLRVICNCNRDKNKSMSYVISDYNFIEMCTIFLANHVTDSMLLRKLIKSTFLQLPESIMRLMALLKPFLEHRNKPFSQDGVSHTAKQFLEKSLKFLMVAKFNQIKNEDKLKNTKENTNKCLFSDKQIEEKLELQRVEVYKKLKYCLKLLGFSESYLKDEVCPARNVYHEWINRQRQQPKKNAKELKNVHGIRILEQDRIKIQRNLEGSHCKIILSKFKVIMMVSINNQTNKAYEEMKKKEGNILIYQKNQIIQKQMELVKKLLKNPEKKQSKNSFENELQFILYIKERGFKYISTYYWQYEKKRSQMQTIIMSYYPHNLTQVIHTQGKFLSFREKLTLIQQITSAVNWLVSNYVCHRDIKPDNIMLDEHRVPKIIDFGSCCPVNGVGGSYFKVKETRLLGTPNYHHAFNQDMCLIYKRNEYQQHLLFDAYSLGKVMRDIFQDGLPNLLPNMQGLMNYIIERCEEQNPADRLTYQQMLFLFDNFIQYLDWLEISKR